MVRCEHFIYALFPTGYKLLRSPGLDKVLSKRNLSYLCHISDRREEEATIQIWFPDEKILSISSIHPVADQYGRHGLWNHTIIISIDDYIQLTQPSNIFKPYFISKLPDPNTALKPLLIGE